MIDINVVLFSHDRLIDEFGGAKGVRDIPGLEAAINRPFATFDQQDLYPSIQEKAAAVFESLIINHPFLDGNKRIAYFMLELLLDSHSYIISVSQVEKYNMVISASMGELRFEGIVSWIKEHAMSS